MERKFKEIINDDVWTLIVLDKTNTKKLDRMNAAETYFHDKKIYFNKKHLTHNIVLHELWHAYFGYCYLSDTKQINLSDIEEISASLFEYNARKIIKKADRVYKRLRK